MSWTEWRGGSCPVSAESMVKVQIRAISRSDAEKREPTRAGGWRWGHGGGPGDIIAFEQTGALA